MRRSTLAALFALALTTRGIHLQAMYGRPFLEGYRTFVASDMYIFDEWARNIAAGDVWSAKLYHPLASWQLQAAPRETWDHWYGESPVFYKAPFYAYLVAGLYRLFDDVTMPLAVLQVVVSSATVCLLAAFAARSFGAAAGTAAGILWALYGPAIHYDLVMLRGPWIVLAGLLVTGALQRLRATPTMGVAAALGAAVGAGLLVNEGFLILPPLLLPLLPFGVGWRRLLALGGALAGGAALVLAPLVVRNVHVGAPPTSIAVTGATVYAVYSSATSDPTFFDTSPSIYTPILEQTDGALGATVIACLRSFAGPGAVVRFYVTKAVGLVVPFENPDNANFYYAALKSPLLRVLPGYGVLLPLALAGIFLARRQWREALPWAPVALALVVAMMMALPLSRYRVPLATMLAPFAGVTCVAIASAAAARRWRAAAAPLASAAAIWGAAALLERQVTFAAVDRAEIEYRATEFFLAGITYGERGDSPRAAEEMVQLARLNPDKKTKVRALLFLADVANRSGRDRALAAQGLAGASKFAAGNPEDLLAVGDAYVAMLGDRAAALAHYRSAMAADRDGRLARDLAWRVETLRAVEGPRP